MSGKFAKFDILSLSFLGQGLTDTPRDRYTRACLRLIAQFKTLVNLLQESVPDVRKFMAEYKVCIVVGKYLQSTDTTDLRV